MSGHRCDEGGKGKNIKVDKKELTEQTIQSEIVKNKQKLAVAVTYDTDNPEKAPLITASGKGTIADEIIKIAEENNVPLYEDHALVNLLSKLELDTEVPPELYVLVAEVLAFVYKLDRMAGKRESVQNKMTKVPKP